MDKVLILFCDSSAAQKLFGFIGQIFDIIMIVIPILIILMGSIDFLKAVIAQKDDEMKKAQSTFIKRLIIGVVVFFVNPIVNFIIGLTGTNTTNPCMACFNNPKSCEIVELNENDETSNNNDNNDTGETVIETTSKTGNK